ncbi:pimeloyl-ACP methyl ester carboxylesterase [Georgenia soli]|uniref:Pimeloyl-ACP methyl ester carboxylesterase n=1 Tax=Georgenia soli TaxID=638953 RepID=A0A2A9ELZ7_9MICO|nr:alpha/beta fold hydrolase [Georgenia soli]PFG39626.1 pimeloyl-ACP methyl ester carboxylesterase [Georgenia soli]
MRVRQVRRGRLVLDVRDEGPVDGGTVLLLHGFPQDGSCWDEVVPALQGEGLRTLAPDQRGYSPGARPPERAAYRLEFLVADAVAVLDAAGVGRAHVVGHDWGGGVAWALAAEHPDRVASLTAVSTPHPRALAGALLSPDQAARLWYMGAFQLPRLPEAVLVRRLPSLLAASGLPDPWVERYTLRMREPGAVRGALNWYRALPLSRLRPGDVTVPTTYLWGAGDPALRRTAARRTGRHVDAPYRFVELSAGHWLPETEPEEVATAVLDVAAVPGG